MISLDFLNILSYIIAIYQPSVDLSAYGGFIRLWWIYPPMVDLSAYGGFARILYIQDKLVWQQLKYLKMQTFQPYKCRKIPL
jgi:hypothetical protein